MRVLSVNVGLPREVVWRGKPITTGIYKEPVAGRVPLRRLLLKHLMSNCDTGDDPYRTSCTGSERRNSSISALIESMYSDEVPLLWFQPGSSC